MPSMRAKTRSNGPNSKTLLPANARIHRNREWWYPQIRNEQGVWQNIPYAGGIRVGDYRGRYFKNVLHRARLAALLMQREHDMTFDKAFGAVMQFGLTYSDIVTGRYCNSMMTRLQKLQQLAMTQPTHEFTLPVRTQHLGGAIDFEHLPSTEQPPVTTEADENTTEMYETTDEPPIGEDTINEHRPTPLDRQQMGHINATLAWLVVLAHDQTQSSDTRRAADDALSAIDWLLKPEQQIIVVKKPAYQRPIYRKTEPANE